MSCRVFRDWMAALAADQLADSYRGELREHLARCAACRAVLWQEEPALAMAFSLPQAGFEDEAFVGEVLTGIHQRRAARRLFRGRLSQLARFAAAVLLAALLVFAATRRFAPHGAAPEGSFASGASEPFVEVEGEGVRVYQLATDQHLQVAFVVSPSVEL